MATALAVVVTVGNPVAGYSRAPLHTWLVVAAIAGPLVGLCLLGARLWPDRAIAAVLLAAVSGASLALFAVLVKGAVDAAKGGIVAVLAAPELYACIGAAIAGMVFQQSAYRGGPLNASMPTMTVAKPTVGTLLGVFVLGETVDSGDETVFVLGRRGRSDGGCDRGTGPRRSRNGGSPHRQLSPPCRRPVSLMAC